MVLTNGQHSICSALVIDFTPVTDATTKATVMQNIKEYSLIYL